MGLSILNELQPIAEELQRYMSPHVLEHLAKEKGFVQRKSKYQAKELVALCVWLSQQVASTSLTQLYVAILKYLWVFLSVLKDLINDLMLLQYSC